LEHVINKIGAQNEIILDHDYFAIGTAEVCHASHDRLSKTKILIPVNHLRPETGSPFRHDRPRRSHISFVAAVFGSITINVDGTLVEPMALLQRLEKHSCMFRTFVSENSDRCFHTRLWFLN